ncbi:unnamed protein product [Symbiodinium microadriaticum]|nr:unnamed protein product [Symbiodinium microadriaticum]
MRLLLFSLVPALLLAQPPGWAVGWGGLDPANADSAGNLREERDEARAQLARCLQGEDAALKGPGKTDWPFRKRPETPVWPFLLGGISLVLLGAVCLWQTRRPPVATGGKFLSIEPDLRVPLRGRRQAAQTAQEMQHGSWADFCRPVVLLRALRSRLSPMRCRPSEILEACRRKAWRLVPSMPGATQNCECSGRIGDISAKLGAFAAPARALVSGCSSCAAKMRKILRGFWRSDDWDLDEEPGLETPVLWRQRAQSARQALQKAQAQLERCLAEAAQRVEETRKKAEAAEAENLRLAKQLAEWKSRAEAAEQLARKSRGEVEELKASFKKAEETASKARQELQSARRRAEVAETIAVRTARVRDVRGERQSQEDRSTSRTRKLDLEARSQPGTPHASPSPRPSLTKASSPSTSTKDKAGSQPGTPRQSAQDQPVRAARRPTAKARAARLPTEGSSTSSLGPISLEDVPKEFHRSSSGPAGTQAREEKTASHEFSYNRALAMLKFAETRAGGSGVPSATSSMQSLPGRVEETLQGLAPVKSSKSGSSAQRFTRVPRLSLDGGGG